jgi:adenine-specific DNA-methyltransferase
LVAESSFVQRVTDCWELGGNPNHQVFGVEIDAAVHALIAEKIAEEFGVNNANLFRRDFFDFEPLPVNQVNVIVGNPPFIRYQKLASETRERALSQAAEDLQHEAPAGINSSRPAE